MLFLIVLAIATAALAVTRRRQPFVVHARFGLAAAMAFAGAAHLFMPDPFVQHLPEWVPEREGLIYASGLAEIVLGVGLLWPAAWRQFAGLALAAYLIAVFPANVYVAVEGVDVDGQPGGIYPWLRLPFQALFVWLALWSTGAIDLLRTVELRRHAAGQPRPPGAAAEVAGG
jgi:uncharacterized membrane protein